MPAVAVRRIELGAELGRGAYSRVLSATRDGQVYAVKVPLESGTAASREMAYRRFLREAVALARVRHPSLPAVMEVGRSGGMPYLVMELAAGETLAERLSRGALSVREVIALGIQLAGALDAIHQAGLIHRDVKPRNIVFDPGSGAARLVDLGSAALVYAGGELVTTPAYAPPEALANTSPGLDARVDLYSLGCVLLESLGVRPASRDNQSPESLPARLAARGVGEGLARVLLQLTAEHPQDRPSRSGQVRAELEALVGPEEVPSSRPYRTRTSLPMCGRKDDLERLRRSWASAQHERRIVMLNGLAGTGKTRLAQEFLAELSDIGTPILAAACHPRDPRAFAAVRQLVEDHVRRCEKLAGSERDQALARLRRVAGDRAPLVKLLSPRVARVFRDTPTLPHAENAEEAFSEALAEFLDRLLEELGPAVVFLDDIQWLDASSRRVLTRAANHRSGRGLLVFGMRSQESAVELDRLSQTIAAPIVRIDLAPLSVDELVDLTRSYLAASDLEPTVRETVLRFSDGTPLRTLEVLRTLLDEGVLLPHWGRWELDALSVVSMHLPGGTASLLRRRIAGLDGVVRRVLVAAAVLGMIVDPAVLVDVAASEREEVGAALAEALRSQLLEVTGDGKFRFIHHNVRETLLDATGDGDLKEFHQRAAEALDAKIPSARLDPGDSTSRERAPQEPDEPQDSDLLYTVAYHYGIGVPGRKGPARVRANIQAGEAAFRRFDSERAIGFFETAEHALSGEGRSIDPQHRLMLAEARLRVGALSEALGEFESVIAGTEDRLLKATALNRIAFVHDLQLDSVKAWRALEQAFDWLGEPLPSGNPSIAAGSVRALVRRARPGERRRAGTPSARDEVLCALYYQVGRVAFSSGAVAPLIWSTLRALEPAERLGPSAELAKAQLLYAFVLTVLGFTKAGSEYMASAERIARELDDRVVQAHAMQVRHVVAAWAGDVQQAIDAAHKCLVEYGHWRELNDFNLVAYSAYELESSRGRDDAAWAFLARAIDRVNRHDGAPIVSELLLLAARGALIGLGRSSDAAQLLHRLERATAVASKASGSYPWTFSPRVKSFTEKMDLGPGFDALVGEFRALKLDPRRAHLGVVEFYIHVAHARVHAALRADPNDRTRLLPELDRALRDLRATARKIALYRAHARVIEGYSHWFHGRSREARQAFDDAEHLAIQETAPWVQYAVYRGRAHMLRAAGRHDAARDQAVLAESVALEHGSVHRARFVREEFGLHSRRGLDTSAASPSASAPLTSDESMGFARSGSRARRQLRALLRISQARAQELSPDHQARVVVDELVQALRAGRGFLFLTPEMARPTAETPHDAEPSALELVGGRDAAGRDLGADEEYECTQVRAALLFGAPQDGEVPPLAFRTATTARLAVMTAPIVVGDVVAGVVYLDRPLADGVFTEADGEVLAALSGQVSVALELTRTLRERERAQEDLLNSEKMEAVARLAGGIAHDLNNMLGSIRMAASAMLSVRGAKDLVANDAQMIQTAVQRAAELTKQLSAFSRGELGRPEFISVNAAVGRLIPVFRDLVGGAIRVEAAFEEKNVLILVDPHQLDQVFTNLIMNAREAMTSGGTITIDTKEIMLDDAYTREHPRVRPGQYARARVSDTGHGMEPEVLKKIFEPYFTTRRDRGGTGLGLASAYWIVSNAGGHIDVTSAPGVGTIFSVYFPVAERIRQDLPGSERRPERSTRPDTQR